MSPEALTRRYIWLALAAYTAADLGRRGVWPAPPGTARRLFTLGAALYLGHVAGAFAVFHDWSHGAAYAETARQTAELTGLDWGGGLYVNYAFTLLWVAETVWWWASPHGYKNRPGALDVTVRAIFLFMIVNGAVVFVAGPTRWVGLLITALLLATWRR